ncbi:MAG: calcineurin-like phosphoesterase C-terminal domain-containing protein [Bacteroidales bacterium]|nr:calcineurin-like phosphoesterase C-terminal domain-containing protein [Bacteroidales bacterium]
MKKIISLLVISLFIGLLSEILAQTMVKGFVFEDLNKNNTREKNEKGVPNVAVSNGMEVTLTGAKGAYELPVGNDNIIFVIKPSDYAVPVNEYNQPQFFYIYKPKGSPELKYAGTPPTGKLPKSVDFPLIPITPKENFKMLLFGDPQPYTEEEVDFFSRGIVSELVGVQDVDFGLSIGDLVGDNLDLHPLYIKAVQPVGIPWYNVMGNHDRNYDVDADSLSDETFEKNFGPATYSFNHGMVHFIILDNILYPDPRGRKGYWGGFRKDQLEFIKNDLSFVPKDRLVVLAFHIPISELDVDGEDPFRDDDRTKLFELLKDFPHTLSISAHTHTQRQDFFDSENGWPQQGRHHHFNVGTTSGSWYTGRLNAEGVPVSTMRDGTLKGYAFLSFNKNQYLIDYKVAGKPADYQFEIYAPKVVEQNKSTSAGIAANFFMGSEYDTLYCRIDSSDWRRMYRVNTFDPSYFRTVLEWDSAEELLDGSRPSNPVECTHIWFTYIPTNLELGKHIIEVKARDMYGRTFTRKSSYRIAVRP